MGVKIDTFEDAALIESIDTRTDDDCKVQIRKLRKSLLEEVDIAIFKAEDANADTADWREYRQALRDMTAQQDLKNPVWPQKPE